jgi:hypothetical protein
MTITLENVHGQFDEESISHDFVVVAEQDELAEPLWGAIGKEDALEPGERRSVTFTPDAQGSFFYICSVPGHASAHGIGGVSSWRIRSNRISTSSLPGSHHVLAKVKVEQARSGMVDRTSLTQAVGPPSEVQRQRATLTNSLRGCTPIARGAQRERRVSR